MKQIYTDGSCPVPHSAGGYAAIIIHEDGREERISGGERETTNNRMEMMGPIMALKSLSDPCEVILTSDSQYVTKGISEWMPKWKSNGWRKKNYQTNEWEEIANIDLWKEIDKLVMKHKVTTNWVRGHQGHIQNEECDRMAGEETQKMKVIK